MSRHDAHGISVELPEGWNGMIYRRRDEDEEETTAAGRGAVRGGATLRVSTVPVDFDEADFGSGIVERLGADDSLVVLFEYTPDERLVPGEGLFVEQGEPWPLDPRAFHRRQLQVNLPGQAGLQRFFTVAGRPFCVYVVVGSARRVATTVRGVNELLASVRIAALG